MTNKKEDIVIYPSKWKLAGVAFGALIFVLLGIIIANSSFLIIIIISYIGVPFFGLGFIYVAYRFVLPKPAVIINSEGIFENASAISVGMIKWEEIAEIFPYEFMGQRFLCILPKDTETILSRQKTIKRILMNINKRMIVNIPQNILPMTIEELLVRIRENYNVKIREGS